MTADQRLWRCLRRLAEQFGVTGDGFIPLTQSDVASMTGVTRATANRLLRQAECDGVIANPAGVASASPMPRPSGVGPTVSVEHARPLIDLHRTVSPVFGHARNPATAHVTDRAWHRPSHEVAEGDRHAWLRGAALGYAVFPIVLAGATHHEQVPSTEVPTERRSTTSWPDPQGPAGAHADDRDHRIGHVVTVTVSMPRHRVRPSR